jgi:hypothetical protein
VGRKVRKGRLTTDAHGLKKKLIKKKEKYKRNVTGKQNGIRVSRN